MRPGKKNKKLRISQLAELSGVTVPTIRYYLNEGLLPPPVKTGKTMAYYDPACVDRIRLIKRLQRERFLPIEVIKRLIDAGEVPREESEIGQVLTKSDLFRETEGSIRAEDLAASTGYPIETIRRLSRSGLVTPRKGADGLCYDALDAELVKLVKKREAAGLSLDFTLRSVEMYRDAIESVVRANTRRVLTHLITDVPVENMGAVLREVEDSLDALVLLLRQKTVRRINEAAVGELNATVGKLGAMILLPVDGNHLPPSLPADPRERALYQCFTGDFQGALNTALSRLKKEEDDLFFITAVLSRLMLGDPKAAVPLVKERLPEPSGSPLINAVAALTYVYAAAFSAGIMGPMEQIKNAWPFLENGIQGAGRSRLQRLLARYICGAIHATMPEIFGFREKGLTLLARVRQSLARGIGRGPSAPVWVTRTLSHEIVPAAVSRIDRLLAQGYAAALLKKNSPKGVEQP